MNTTVGGKSTLPGYEDIGDFSKAFEIGLLVGAGNTFAVTKSFQVTLEARYEYEYDLSQSFNFNNIGAAVQFAFR